MATIITMHRAELGESASDIDWTRFTTRVVATLIVTGSPFWDVTYTPDIWSASVADDCAAFVRDIIQRAIATR